MITFVYNVFDPEIGEDFYEEIVAESIDEAEEMMEMKYDVKHYFWKLTETIEI